MKKITLLKKKIPSPLCPYCLRGLDDKELDLKAVELIRAAIEGNPENRKGLSNIGKALRILNKIEETETTKTDILEIVDADFELIYKCIDQADWAPLSLKFPEFFREIERVKQES